VTFPPRPAFLGLAALTLVTDQVTKSYATAHLAPVGSVPILPGLLDLTYVRNQGAVFGLLRDVPAPWRGLILTLVPLLAIGLVLMLARGLAPGHRRARASLALVLGGALGNLIDRIRLGWVVDFVDLHVAGWHWPAFNVADSAICVGVALLALDLGRPARDPGSDARARHASDPV